MGIVYLAIGDCATHQPARRRLIKGTNIQGVSFFRTEHGATRFLGQLEDSYNIDQDSIVIHIFEDSEQA